MKIQFSFILTLLFFASATNLMAQAKLTTVGGRVISFEESTAIEGVSVFVKGTNRNTGTQADGTFNIEVSLESSVLVFQHIEYETQEVKITSSTDYDIVLKKKIANAASRKDDSADSVNKPGNLRTFDGAEQSNQLLR